MSPDFVFDPRKMITGPFRECPKCSNDTFGTLSIYPNHIQRRCRECSYSDSKVLPDLNKQILYLDQFVLSNMAKVLDPLWKKERGSQIQFYSDVFDSLDRSRQLQLVVCPESKIHEKESVVHKHFPVLRRLYEHFANGTDFELPEIIHYHQLAIALQAHLVGRSVDYSEVPIERIIHGEVNGWTNNYSITVRGGIYPDPQQHRIIRKSVTDGLRQAFKEWAEEKNAFEEVYAGELRGGSTVMIDALKAHQRLLKDVVEGKEELTEDVWNPKITVDSTRNLFQMVLASGVSKDEAADVFIEFMYSNDALQAPLNHIRSLLFAAIARRAAAGQKRVPSSGMANDIIAISAYLPYCDAMFLDNECAELLNEEPLKSRIKYPTQIFSLNNKQQFLEYLSSLKDIAGAEHLSLVDETYGMEGVTPFRSILENERLYKS